MQISTHSILPITSSKMTVPVSEIFFRLSSSFRRWTATALEDSNDAMSMATRHAISHVISRVGATNGG